MSTQGNYNSETFVATGDLSGSQHHIVEITGSREVGLPTGSSGIGVLMNKPQAGEHATVKDRGYVKVKAGVAMSVGDYFTSASGGFAVPINSGDALPAVQMGRAVTAASSGKVFEGFLRIANVFNAVSGSVVA